MSLQPTLRPYSCGGPNPAKQTGPRRFKLPRCVGPGDGKDEWQCLNHGGAVGSGYYNEESPYGSNHRTVLRLGCS
jgi:hypothetical protein